MRTIAKEQGHSYWTIRSALERAERREYRLQEAKPAPVLGSYKARIVELLSENEQLPAKQRYTGHKIYQIVQGEGYRGSESSIRRYVGLWRRAERRPVVYLPLSYKPGEDGQVDWGEAVVRLQGEEKRVELFVLRLCYSRKVFAMVFPTQRQECFFAGHVAAFEHLGGVPQRLSYDNLKTAVKQVLEGKNRVEQGHFVTFRSHYLFESRFCTPGEGHEKGGVEHGVGYVRRNFMTPLLSGESYADLNQQLLAACVADEQRCVARQSESIGAMLASERTHLRSLPEPFACYRSHQVVLNPYGQVVFETNRYSVPADQAEKHLVLRAWPFHIEILGKERILARHERCYGREQDILDPLHYLPLLAQRPGAFEHATPMRQWRTQWPPLYEQLLRQLRQTLAGESAQQGESRAVRQLCEILLLQRQHPALLVEQAIQQALAHDIAHLEGVRFCLNRLLDPTPVLPPLSLTDHPTLVAIGTQPVSLHHYNQLLGGGE